MQVFAAAGIVDPHLAFGINSLLNVCWIFGAFLGGICLDVFGRRFNYITGLTQMGCFLIIQGALAIRYFDGQEVVSKAAGGIWVVSFSSLLRKGKPHCRQDLLSGAVDTLGHLLFVGCQCHSRRGRFCTGS